MEFQGVVDENESRGFRERDAEQNRLDQLRDDYYSLSFAPRDMTDTATFTNINNVPAVLFTDGADRIGRLSTKKPSLWRHGRGRLELWWCTDGTLTTDIDVDIDLRGSKVDDTTGNSTSLFSSSEVLTASGVAYQTTLSTYETTTNIVNEHVILSGVIERLGSTDANTDELFLLRAHLTFLPVYRQ